MQSNSPVLVDPVAITDEVAAGFTERTSEQLAFKIVTDDGAWLRAAYEVLQSCLDPKGLEPFAQLQQALQASQQGTSPRLLIAAAFVTHGDRAHVVGAVSGTVTPIANLAAEPAPFVAALRHQATAAAARTRGVKGVGRRLWQFWLDEAHRLAREQGGAIPYSVLEADVDSVGFWDRLGYRWPQGVRYWQPPAQFNASGDYVNPEAPAILMARPASPADDRMARGTLERIIETLYRASLARQRTTLTPTGFERAERYLMDVVFARVTRIMPDDPTLNLVRVPMEDALQGGRRHVRSVALDQGIQHGLTPLKAIRSTDVEDFDDLLQAMKGMAFGARTLGHAADVLHAMMTDRGCKVVLTLSGAVSVAKMDLMLAELVERGLVHAIVTTGAIVCHGFNSERGSAHFVVPEDRTDTWLFEHGYNRIYDTIETEFALDELQEISHAILRRLDTPVVCSSDIVRLLGEYLVSRGMDDGLLQAAYRRQVPVFIPAFTDSELGLDFALFNHYQRAAGKPEVRYDPFIDFERYRDFATSTKVRGILTLGGGVPRNWAQQIGPYLDAVERAEHAVAVNSARFKYGLRICPDPAYWGGLSGCTYSEGISWGKFVASDEGGMVAEVLSDFTFVLPLLVKGLFQRLAKTR